MSGNSRKIDVTAEIGSSIVSSSFSMQHEGRLCILVSRIVAIGVR